MRCSGAEPSRPCPVPPLSAAAEALFHCVRTVPDTFNASLIVSHKSMNVNCGFQLLCAIRRRARSEGSHPAAQHLITASRSFSSRRSLEVHISKSLPLRGEEMATRDLTRDGTAATKRSGVYTPRNEADEVVRRKAQSFSRIKGPPHQSSVGDSFSALFEGRSLCICATKHPCHPERSEKNTPGRSGGVMRKTQLRAAFAISQRLANAFMSVIARSARTLRLMSTLASFRPLMRRL